MKTWKKVLIVIAAVIAGVALIFILMNKGDEPVSQVALTNSQLTDMKMMDSISSSKGMDLAGYQGTLFTTACDEYSHYTVTSIAPIQQGTGLWANVLFIESPEGMEYKSVWSLNAKIISEEAISLTSDGSMHLAGSFLDGSLVQQGKYTFAVYYKDKLLYNQTFEVE